MLELTIRLIVSLAIVVGLLLVLARLGARKFRGNSNALVHVVHRQPLSRTSSVSVVTVGGRVLVLGTTEQQISVLTELDPEELETEEASWDEFAALISSEDVPELGPAQPAGTAVVTGTVAATQAAPAEQPDPKPAVPARPSARPAARFPGQPRPEAMFAPLAAAQPVAQPAQTILEQAEQAEEAAKQAAARAPKPVREPLSQPALELLAQLPEEPFSNLRPRRTAKAVSPLRLASKSDEPGSGPLAGSVLSPQTWRQAFAAATGKMNRRAS